MDIEQPVAPDPNELRRFRATVEQARWHQQLARGGLIAAALPLYAMNSVALRGTMAPTIALAIAPLVVIGTAIPFFRAKCPKCKGRYQSWKALFRSASDPPPCVSCGFDLNAHIPRYGRA